MTYVEIIAVERGPKAASPWMQRIHRYRTDNSKSATVNFRDPWGRSDLQPLGNGAILGKGFDDPSVTEEEDHSAVDDSGPDPIALVIVAPPGTALNGLSRPPDDAKVWTHADGGERLVYYWHVQNDPSGPRVTSNEPNYRQQVRWEAISEANDLQLAAIWARTKPAEVHPGLNAELHVTFPPAVVDELIKAHYPRRITAVDRDRAQAQLAMSGLTALVGVGFAAVSLSAGAEASMVATVVSSVAVAAWLATAVLAALALGQPEAPYVPVHDVGREDFVRGLLEHIGLEVAKARKGLRRAFVAAAVAVIATALAVLLLLLSVRA